MAGSNTGALSAALLWGARASRHTGSDALPLVRPPAGLCARAPAECRRERLVADLAHERQDTRVLRRHAGALGSTFRF